MSRWRRDWKSVVLAWQVAERWKVKTRKGLKSKFPGPLLHFSEVRVLTARKQAVSLQFHRLQNPQKTCSPVRCAEFADSAHASSQVICLSSPPAYAHSSSQSPSEVSAPTQSGIMDSIQRAYETLVHEEMLPQGFEPQFRYLCTAARTASLRVERKWARATPMQVGMLAWQRTREHEHTANAQKSVELQMLYAGAQAPKKARSRLAQMVFNTATARQDAENAERLKWIACLSQLVAGTATPLGQRLVQRPAEVASMGLGLRAGTLRNRAHVLRRYFLWLAQSFRLPFPEQEEHYLDYLALRVQEPCTRCTLKCVHQSFVYLEEVSEIEPHRRVTVRQRYSNMLAELLSRTLPGSQADKRPDLCYVFCSRSSLL